MKLNRMNHTIAIVFSVLMAFSVTKAMAQTTALATSQSVSISTTEEGKVKLKVVKKEGNDETTFEKIYDSHQEMMNDPELEKYGINPNGFGFGQRSSKPRFFFQNGPSRGFWDDDMEEMSKRMQDMMRNFSAGSFPFDWDDTGEINMDSLFKQFGSGAYALDIDSLRSALQNGFQSFNYSYNDNDDDIKVIRRTEAVVSSATTSDKKLVGADDMSELELLDLSFYPNPSDGRFDLNIKTKKDRPIQINVVDSAGNEVLNRVGIPEKGAYRLTIDLSHEDKGTYVLKMVQGKEALAKRIVLK